MLWSVDFRSFWILVAFFCLWKLLCVVRSLSTRLLGWYEIWLICIYNCILLYYMRWDRAGSWVWVPRKRCLVEDALFTWSPRTLCVILVPSLYDGWCVYIKRCSFKIFGYLGERSFKVTIVFSYVKLLYNRLMYVRF